MDAISPLTLPGNFEAAATYLIKGATLIAWRKALQADRAVVGSGLKESGGPQGRIFSLDPAGDTGLNFYLKTTAFGWYTVEMSGHQVMVFDASPTWWSVIKFTDGRAVERWSEGDTYPTFEAGYAVIENTWWNAV